MIVAGCDDDLARWVIERVPLLALEYRDGKRLFSAIGWEHDGRIIAAVVYDEFKAPNICMHIAAEPGTPWMHPLFLGECFRYPFNQLKVARVTGKTPVSNVASLKFQAALGFVREGRVRCAMPNGEDLIITGMLRSECRWLTTGLRNEQGLASRCA